MNASLEKGEANMAKEIEKMKVDPDPVAQVTDLTVKVNELIDTIEDLKAQLKVQQETPKTEVTIAAPTPGARIRRTSMS
jgi:hypothetical protein